MWALCMLPHSPWGPMCFCCAMFKILVALVASIPSGSYTFSASSSSGIWWRHPLQRWVLQNLSLSAHCLAMFLHICSHLLQDSASLMEVEQGIDLWIQQNVVRVFLLLCSFSPKDSHWEKQPLLSIGPMFSSRWPTQNKFNGIFGDSLSHNAVSGYPHPLKIPYMCIMASSFGFLWDFCVCKCVHVCVSAFICISHAFFLASFSSVCLVLFQFVF